MKKEHKVAPIIRAIFNLGKKKTINKLGKAK